MVFLEMISNDLSNVVPTHAPHWMEVLLTDGDIPVNLMNQPLPLAYTVKFNILKQFSVPPIPRIWMNLVTNVLTGGQEEWHIQVYIPCHPWHLRWLHFLSPNPVILWNDQELHSSSASSCLWWHKKEPFITWRTFDHKILPQIPSTHGVFKFPCQRISGRHHVRDWSCWITTFSLDSQALQWIRDWNSSFSNHSDASFLSWHREKSYIKDRTNCQTKQ